MSLGVGESPGAASATTFGRRQAAPVSPPLNGFADPGAWAAFCAMLTIAALMSLHVWWSVLRVEPQMPIGSLLALRARSEVGWAPWPFAPLLGAALTAPLAALLLRRAPAPVSFIRLFVVGWLALTAGSLGAHLARNIGYVVHFVPGMTPVDLIKAMPAMLMHDLAMAGPARDASPGLLLMACAILVIVGAVIGSPLRHAPPPAATPATQAATLTPGQRRSIALLAGVVAYMLFPAPVTGPGAASARAPAAASALLVLAMVHACVLRDGVFSMRHARVTGVLYALAGVASLLAFPFLLPREADVVAAMGIAPRRVFVAIAVAPAILIGVVWASARRQLRRPGG